MAINSLRSKITAISKRSAKNKFKPLPASPQKRQRQVAGTSTTASSTSTIPSTTTENDESYQVSNYNVSIFGEFPNFHQLRTNELDLDPNLDDEDDELNLSIITKSIEFLKSIKFDDVKRSSFGRITQHKIVKRRNNYPDVIILNQLYSIFVGDETYIDLKIDKLVKNRVLKIINLSYDELEFKLIILLDDLVDLITFQTSVNKISKFEEEENKHFIQLLKDYPNLVELSPDLLSAYELSATSLISRGFLTLSKANQTDYKLSLPSLGPVLKMLRMASKTIYKLIKNTSRANQMLESDLKAKWEFNDGHFRKMSGVNLLWCLSLMSGLGVVEGFNSPMGRVWRLTGKKP